MTIKYHQPKDFEIVNNEGYSIIESGDFKIFVGGSSPKKRSLELVAPKMEEIKMTVK